MRNSQPLIPQSIAAGISRLQRPDSDALPIGWNPRLSGFVRIASLACEGEPSRTADDLQRTTAVWLRGLAGLKSPWVFALQGDTEKIGVFWGVSGGAESVAAEFRSRFAAAFPGSEIDETIQSGAGFSAQLSGFSHVACFSGNPIPADQVSASQGNQAEYPATLGTPGLEALVRSMEGRRWTWLVCGQPETDDEINLSLRGFRDELKELNSAYLRQGTVEQENHPAARHYADLLEQSIANHERGQREGMFKVTAYFFGEDTTTLERGANALHGILSNPAAGPEPIRVRACASPFHMEPSLMQGVTHLTSAEVACLVSPPAESFVGFEIRRVERFRPAPPEPGAGPRVALGTIQGFSGNTRLWFEVLLKQLAGHTLIGGITGSGKTTTLKFLLRQLWQEHHIPWLATEPSAKCEHRQLLREEFGDDLRIFTAGNETVAPLRLNPLNVPPGIPVQQHIDSLCSLFCAAFSWVTPMPYVLSASMHRLYEEFGWDLVAGSHPNPRSPESHPTLSDLVPVVEQVTRECGWDSEITANVTAGIRTRLESLTRGGKGRLLDSRSSHSMADLLSQPTVIELSAIGDEDEKAFLMGILFLKIAQHRQVEGLGQEGLRHVLVIEEAHRLLSAASSSGAFEAAESRSKAIELFSNLMAEIRAFGQGLIVVDQIPGKLASEVIRNTNLKVIHRLPAVEDREAVGGAMALSEGQIGELARLRCGEAVVHSSGHEDASRIVVPRRSTGETPAEVSVTSAEVSRHMQPWLLPFVATASSKPASPIQRQPRMPGDLPRCRGCDNTSCKHQRQALNALSSRNYSTAFRQAANDGWEALWHFGTNVAKEAMNGEPTETMPPELPYCILMNLATLADWDESVINRMKRNLGILANRENRFPKQ